MPLSFATEHDPRYGEVVELTPLVRRVTANNPGKFTGWGTGTYIVGRGAVAVIDPGPDDAAHTDRILDAVRGEEVTHILVTHTHRDHSPGSRRLQAATGAPTFGFGPHPSIDLGRSPTEVTGEGEGEGEGEEEPGDAAFTPDVEVTDGDVIATAGWTVEALHTPGHISNHLCFALREEAGLFSGDHVMGWSTTVIPPPDGDMADYLASLRRLLPRDDRVLWPTHGPPVTTPREHVEGLIAHRLEREHQVLTALAAGDLTVAELVAVLYADVRTELHKAAGRSVLAHLRDLRRRAMVDGDPEDPDRRWTVLCR